VIHGDTRCISVAKLREILNDPKNKIRDDDLVCVNRVGNLHFLVRTSDGLMDARMWIDLAQERCEWVSA